MKIMKIFDKNKTDKAVMPSSVRQVEGGALVVEKQPLPSLNEVHLGGEILLAPRPALCLRLPSPSHPVEGRVRPGAGASGADFYRKYFSFVRKYFISI